MAYDSVILKKSLFLTNTWDFISSFENISFPSHIASLLRLLQLMCCGIDKNTEDIHFFKIITIIEKQINLIYELDEMNCFSREYTKESRRQICPQDKARASGIFTIMFNRRNKVIVLDDTRMRKRYQNVQVWK